jgi:hypothetical protein
MRSFKADAIPHTGLREVFGDIYSSTRFEDHESRALTLEAEAQFVRRAASLGYLGLLDAEVEKVRKDDFYSGNLQGALLHYFGRNIDDELLLEIENDFDGEAAQYIAFLEFAEKLAGSTGITPVIINAPQYEIYSDGETSRRDYWLVMVDPSCPFYATQEYKDGVLMHAFTGETASVEARSFGILGKSYHIQSDVSELSIGQTTNRAEQPRNFVQLIHSEVRADGRLSGYGTYAYGGVHESQILSGNSESASYIVGWEEVEGLVLSEKETSQRVKAAKLVCEIVPKNVKLREVMPRVAKIIRAAKILDEATA